MPRVLLAIVVAFSTVTTLGAAPSAADQATHTLAVSGTGVGMYPAFDGVTERYALTTTDETAGAVQLTATTSDLEGTVLVNGRPTSGATTTVTGLEDGDEISVIFEDSDATTVHSLVYLPAGFPELEVTADEPGTSPGMVGLTLSKWSGDDPSFETAVDVNAVPVYVRSAIQQPMDLKRQPNGSYSVSRPTSTPGRTGHAVVELDEQFREVASYETEGLVNTDAHDSLLMPDGSRFLIAYEANPRTGMTDSVIQEFAPDGTLVWEWNSADHVDIPAETTLMTGGADYAHINSIQVMADGDVLASFRHLSSVFKIARTAHDGFAVGDVVWRLGGKLSDFRFLDDPYPSGPCAQHTATQLDNGNILLFDNGSGWPGQVLCVDADEPAGPSVSRTVTRMSEYTLDEETGTATLVWDYQVPGRWTFFAGSVERLPNGNTLIGWASSRVASTTEVGPNGDVLWEVRDRDNPDGSAKYMSYRSDKFEVPDAVDPRVNIGIPADGASYPLGSVVIPDYTCTDRGGSNLQSCVPDSEMLDTSSVGEHTVTVTATDGAGNTTTASRSYRIEPAFSQPDALVRGGGSGWTGHDVYGGWSDQRVVQKLRRKGQTVTSVVRVQNDGDLAERFAVRATRRNAMFNARYVVGGRNVTQRVVAGSYRTPRLDPGEQLTLRVKVTRTKKASPGDRRTFVVRAFGSDGKDAVSVAVRATGR